MKSFRYVSIILLLGISLGCGPDLPAISGFDAYIWERDKFGCGQERIKMIENLMDEREKVIGFRETEVLALLGKADEQEMYSRNQKFLIYYLEPNPKCSAPENAKATAKALHVRINAIGVANELYISTR